MKQYPDDRVLPAWRDEFRKKQVKQKIYCGLEPGKCFAVIVPPRERQKDLPQKKRPPDFMKPAKQGSGSEADIPRSPRPIVPKKTDLKPPRRGASKGSGMKSRTSSLKAICSESWQDFQFQGSTLQFRNTPRVSCIDSINVTMSTSGGKDRVYTPHAYTTQRGTSLSGTRTITKHDSKGKLMYWYMSVGPAVDGPNGGLPNPANPSISYNKALGKLHEKLRGTLDLSVSFAEHGQVTGMLRKASRLATYVSGFNRRTLASKWLEFTYGWKPLAKDLFESIQQLSNRAGNSLELKSRASHIEENAVKYYTGHIWSETDLYASHRTEMCVQYAPSTSYLDTMLRYSSLNPVSIAWELVPYSFVFDWFVDVGGYLRMLETSLMTPGTVLRGYVTTTQSQRISETTFGSGRPDAQNFRYFGTLKGQNVKNTKSRVLISSLPLPRKPAFKVELGASRLISAASLLAMKLGVPKDKAKRTKIMTSQKWDNFSKRAKRVKVNPWNDPLYTR